MILNKQTHFLDFYQTKITDWPLGYNKAWKGIFFGIRKQWGLTQHNSFYWTYKFPKKLTYNFLRSTIKPYLQAISFHSVTDITYLRSVTN